MMKKMIGLIVIVVLLVGAVVIGALLLSNNKEKAANDNTTTSSKVSTNNGESLTHGDSKILVVYYSATNNTKTVAEKIANNLDADLFEIVPDEIYTADDLDWTNVNSRVSKEHDDENLRDIKLKNTIVSNWDNYDTVIIGYPIWWGVAAWPMNSFVKANDFDGKTVIPFCTSASSGLGQSGKLLESVSSGGNWREGQRFSSSTSDTDIKAFTDSIKKAD